MGNNLLSYFMAIFSAALFFSITPLVYAQTATPGPCTDTVPTEAPNLYQITPGQSSATLYFSPPSGMYTGFLISYGLDSNANTYNATMSQGVSSGAITYTVNALSPNTLYYFKVQAINNCASGPFSSVVSTTSTSSTGTVTASSGSSSSGSIKTPVTGPEDVIYFGIAALLVSVGGFGVFLKNK